MELFANDLISKGAEIAVANRLEVVANELVGNGNGQSFLVPNGFETGAGASLIYFCGRVLRLIAKIPMLKRSYSSTGVARRNNARGPWSAFSGILWILSCSALVRRFHHRVEWARCLCDRLAWL